MTAQMNPLENALYNASGLNSQMHKVVLAYADNSNIPTFYPYAENAVQSRNSTPCKVYNIDVAQETNAASTSEFGKLLDSLESDTESAYLLSQARKWVSETLYNDEPTLASLRLAAGLSQTQLGIACSIKQPHVSRYESGKHEPSITVSIQLAKALGINLESFAEAWSNSRKISQPETEK
jgi:DNA-binding XRE family transcriptional regulator